MIPRRITIDSSHTAGSGKNTGIERVVRNLCLQMPDAADYAGISACQVATHIGGEFYTIDSKQHRGLHWLSRVESNVNDFLPRPWAFATNQLVRLFPTRKVKKWLAPEPSHLGAYKLPHHVYRLSVEAARRFRGGALQSDAGDLWILPDAYWTKRDIWDTVKRQRESGAFIATLVYDLIPLTHPQFVGERRSEKFKHYLEQVIMSSDLIVAISKTVRDEVVRYIESEMPGQPDACRDVRAFTLGAEIKHSQGDVRESVEKLFSPNASHPPYLMVASFDPRKNHHQAINAFEVLWKKHPELKLCFAGRVGAFCTDVVERIRSHAMFNKSLFMFSDLRDAELQEAYRHCSGVLLPSYVEGFGLPIVESLWHGKKTFASDTPIHREVGGEHCEYFQLDSPESLADLILKWEGERRPLVTSNHDGGSQRFVPTSWEQSAQQLLHICLDAYAQQREAPPNRQTASRRQAA